jgi:hypothetical protein
MAVQACLWHDRRKTAELAVLTDMTILITLGRSMTMSCAKAFDLPQRALRDGQYIREALGVTE